MATIEAEIGVSADSIVDTPVGGGPSLLDWLDDTVVSGAVAIALVGLLGLAAALIGVFGPWLAPLLVVVPFAVVGLRLRKLKHVTIERSSVEVLVALVVVVLVALGAYSMSTSQNVLVTRDPAVYSNTAAWLDDNGSLFVDADPGPFADRDGLTFGTAGIYDEGSDGDLEFQFPHLTAVLLATVADLGGTDALFRLPALIAALGLVGVFGVARRIAGSDWMAVGATAVYGLTLPVLSVARETYSEAFAVFFLWIGLVGLARAHERARDVDRRVAVLYGSLAGVLLGATLTVRADSIAYLVVVISTLVVLLVDASDEHAMAVRRMVAAVALGLVPGTALGSLDVEIAAGRYAEDLPSGLDIARLGAMGLAVLLVLIIGRPGPARRVWVLLERVRPGACVALAAAGVLALAVGWQVRPRVSEVRGSIDNGFLALIQEAQGLPADGTLLYAEDSVRWLEWYLGAPTLVLAIVGVGLLIARLGGQSLHPSLVAVGGLLATQATYYLWNPSITPDQIWAMRRFVPVILPVFVIAAWLAVDWLARRLGSGYAVGVAALSLSIVVPVGLALWPVRSFRTQHQALGVVESVCAEIGPSAAVVFVEPEPAVPAVRGFCDVPVAVATEALTEADLRLLAGEWEEHGRSLYLAARSPEVINARFSDVGPIQPSVVGRNDRRLERTVDGRPDSYENEIYQLHVSPVLPAGA